MAEARVRHQRPKKTRGNPKPDPKRWQLSRSSVEPSTFDEVIAAITVAAQIHSHIYVDRRGSEWRWSFATPGFHELRRVMARFLKLKEEQLRIPFVKLDDVCLLAPNPDAWTPPRAHTVLKFRNKPSREVVERALTRAFHRLADSKSSTRGKRPKYWAEIDPKRRGDFAVIRRGWGHVIWVVGSPEFAEAEVKRFRRQELTAEKAFKSGDARLLCALGWHQRDKGKTYFRYGSTMKNTDGSVCIYRFADQPFEYRATTIWCYSERGKPWRCEICGQLVDGTELDER